MVTVPADCVPVRQGDDHVLRSRGPYPRGPDTTAAHQRLSGLSSCPLRAPRRASASSLGTVARIRRRRDASAIHDESEDRSR
jgi:hypothetical protein